MDKPVRTYSSGMYSKLAFSITAILETDIMLIDEVLSVGCLLYTSGTVIGNPVRMEIRTGRRMPGTLCNLPERIIFQRIL